MLGFKATFIFVFIGQFTQLAWAESRAKQECDQLRQEIVSECRQFVFNRNSYYDRISLESDSSFHKLSQSAQYHLSGTGCHNIAQTTGENVQQLSIIFKAANNNGSPQCAVWKSFRNSRGEAFVEEVVFEGRNQTRLQRFTQKEFSSRPFPRDLALDREADQASFLRWLGRQATPLLDAVGIGSEPEHVEFYSDN